MRSGEEPFADLCLAVCGQEFARRHPNWEARDDLKEDDAERPGVEAPAVAILVEASRQLRLRLWLFADLFKIF